MTTNELHDILESEKRLSIYEVRDILYRLKCACIREGNSDYETGFYGGEVNAFYIALDLLEKLEVPNDKD